MEKEIFFLGNFFPKYKELVPYIQVNYFSHFFRKPFPKVKLSPDMRRVFPRFSLLIGKKFPSYRKKSSSSPIVELFGPTNRKPYFSSSAAPVLVSFLAQCMFIKKPMWD